MINAYAAFEAKGQLKEYSYEPGSLNHHDVEIEVDYCGICHSDISMLNNEWGMSQYPLVAGHEVVGRVSAIGEHVTSVSVGDLVGLGWHSDYCHHCHSCNTGDENLCQQAMPTVMSKGGFADKVRANERAVVALPKHLNAQTAGPLFCGGITVFNPLVQFDVKPTDKVAVIGIGGLGHLALQFLNAWGCEVTAFTSSDAKAQEALKLGAHHTLNSRNQADIENAAERFDFIISTVNVKLDWNLYLSTLKPKGRLHFVGATLEPLDIGVFGLIAGQKQISGSPVGSPATIAQMLEFAAQHNIEPQVELFKMSEINQAIKHLESGKAHYRIVLERE
ncbi:NAD(P)-dependent alcohol dehydrogenase [Catenovulum sp. 2E275]|uniref:NADPH-dependent aldehyde reductase Ahr n=1 Tax=Catenovulum sp. 2E275 TaxID=2980497 RepID=UPI0021D3AB2E|nr:NAD(P)-dependent alcohol dehydrogenase [Catenovulum sp. 2E275]MCU4676503.1 NAD(P)-dependent alcohol dehydrogenase [Catenovulum sp. 2E275]